MYCNLGKLHIIIIITEWEVKRALGDKHRWCLGKYDKQWSCYAVVSLEDYTTSTKGYQTVRSVVICGLGCHGPGYESEKKNWTQDLPCLT